MEIELLLADDGLVKSGYKMFRDFFMLEYMPVCRSSPSISSLPNGQAVYDSYLRFHTTTNLTAAEIHDIGLKEVASIESRYKLDVMTPLGVDAENFRDFVMTIKGNPTHYASSTEGLLDHYRAVCTTIEKVLPLYFAEFPRSPLIITSKTQGPAAYYLAGTADGKRPGRFYVNVSHISRLLPYN